MFTCIINGREIPFKGILFDKDGTLLDFLSLWGAWALEVTELMVKRVEKAGSNLTVDPRKLLGLILDPDGLVAGYDPTGPVAMATEEQTVGVLTWQLYTAGVPWNEALRQVKELLSEAMQKVKSERNARPMPGLNELLEQCRQLGIPLGVVTADRTSEAREHLRWMNLEGYFGTIVGTDRVVQGKPAPDMVFLACTELGLLPEEVLVIGDSNGDMQMAKASGAAGAIGFCPGGEADYLLDAEEVIQSYDVIDLKGAEATYRSKEMKSFE
ncbi:HAD family hydrolase [Paenibacillus physcomitrellae]|uniref:Haloacid dehalogenase n=1 Tax=Paenibacillus physcomitrellae TaxID=1619311 RepID=A0ABQ1GDE4_9BACL|nr:HAD family hydrolase [Paenibacillus physcomitrellae]GGA41482.1 hypothetical protein GCM10010917_28460 [Paenibacillus physcomitrellae]